LLPAAEMADNNNAIDKLAAGLTDKLKVDAAPFVPASLSSTVANKAPQKRKHRGGGGTKTSKPTDTTSPVDSKDLHGKQSESSPSEYEKKQNNGPNNKSDRKNKPSGNKGKQQQQQRKDSVKDNRATNNKRKSNAKKKIQDSNLRVEDNRDEKRVAEVTSKQTQKQDKQQKTIKPNKKSAISSSSASSNKPAIPPNQPQTTNDLNYGAGQAITVVHIAEKPR
jgi:hypothetical protein